MRKSREAPFHAQFSSARGNTPLRQGQQFPRKQSSQNGDEVARTAGSCSSDYGNLLSTSYKSLMTAMRTETDYGKSATKYCRYCLSEGAGPEVAKEVKTQLKKLLGLDTGETSSPSDVAVVRGSDQDHSEEEYRFLGD